VAAAQESERAEGERRKKEEAERERKQAEREKRREEQEKKREEQEKRRRGEEEARRARSQADKVEVGGGLGSLPKRDEVIAEPQQLLLQAMGASAAPPTVKKCGPCDKCDGDHHADDCPHFKKKRDEHADAWDGYGTKGQGSGEDAMKAEGAVIQARVQRQPGDGSCLFHSLSHGLGGGSAGELREQCASFVVAEPDTLIAGSPVRDWLQWESGLAPAAYASRMRSQGQWGGAIEIAITCHLKQAEVRVYEAEADGGRFRCISRFGSSGSAGSRAKVVTLLYSGGSIMTR